MRPCSRPCSPPSALKEIPSAAGFAGVALVALGSWVLYAGHGGSGTKPLRRLVRERGSRLMFAVALIFSVTSAFGKVGVRHSSAGFFGPAYVAALAICLALVETARGRGRALLSGLKPNRWFIAIGVGVAAMTILHFAALERTQVGYMVAVKRSGLLASVILGRVFFDRKGCGTGCRAPG
jgi:uncharacterized membrane protein